MNFKEEQELYLKMKPHLRFKCGDVVFIKTDLARKIPLTINRIIDPFIDSMGDYTLQYFDSQKCLKTDCFFDVALISDDR